MSTLAIALCIHLVFGLPLQGRGQKSRAEQRDSTTFVEPISYAHDSLLQQAATRDTRVNRDSLLRADSLSIDSLIERELQESITPDSLAVDSLARDTTAKKKQGFLDDVISGKNKDSLVYDVKNKMVYIYREGDIIYQEMNLKADYMQVNMETKDIFAYGYTDSLGVKTRPEFTDKGEPYTMDTIHYNIDTEKAKIKGVARQEGEGFLTARDVKKMKDNTSNIMGGRYTTCDNPDHPHFYLAMTKAKVLPGKKIITGPSHFVMEDVPIYFLGIPFGFFPITSGRKSGFIIPTFGEEYVKGFYIREGGYYFAFNDYIDVTALGGIYTLGSWEASLQSNYIKRYKYRGGLNLRYSQTKIGEKEDTLNYVNSSSFSFQWTHSQDPKFKPNSNFSASVNFSSSGFKEHGANNLNDHLTTQTNSSISYSKTWAGKPYSFSTNMQHSQNSRDGTISISLPNVVFNVSQIHPFRRKNATGKERWYEKIQTQYSFNMSNNISVKENELFSGDMLKKMKNGVKHTLPISASINLFNYINVTPSINYTEYWYFRKVDKVWSEAKEAVIPGDTTYGFYRLYDYSISGSLSTKVYGTFLFKNTNAKIQAIRHVMTPSLSFSYKPDFGDPRYGYHKPIQTNKDGTVGYYSPYEGNMYGVPGRGENMSMSFSLGNTLEMKVKSDKDTSGVKKIKLIDQLSFSGSYNFLASEFKLSTISANLRTIIYGNYGLNVSATFDPYQLEEIDGRLRRVDKFMIRKGSLARLTQASSSFSYQFNSQKGAGGGAAMNDMQSGGAPTQDQNDFFSRNEIHDPEQQRMLMSSQYYDFSIPWNVGFSYSFSYRNNESGRDISQTLSFNGSLNLTDKWGVNFSGGYDFDNNRISSGTITVNRDLHCWQMNFSWTPVGRWKSWNFHISIKSNVLRDIKWDKRSSYYDSILD